MILVPLLNPKFANLASQLACELQNQRDASNLMILVPLLNPRFAIGLTANLRELRVRGTSAVDLKFLSIV
jgi:hypothetical protein